MSTTSIEDEEPEYYLIKGFLKSKKSQKILDYFCNYEYSDSYVKVYGKKYKIPRNQTAFGDNGTFYRFSGSTVYAKDWDELGDLKEIFDSILKRLSKIETFNFCLVNHYETGENHIGYHSDDEKDLKTSIIASISVGATRRFLMKNKKSGKVVEVKLRNGDLLIMHGSMQEKWLHSVPKEKSVLEPRVNLTFRSMKINKSNVTK